MSSFDREKRPGRPQEQDHFVGSSVPSDALRRSNLNPSRLVVFERERVVADAKIAVLMAIRDDDTEQLKNLIASGADIHLAGASLLQVSMEQCSFKAARVLLDNGASAKGVYLKLPTNHIGKGWDVELLADLLKAGAVPNCAVTGRSRAFEEVCFYGTGPFSDFYTAEERIVAGEAVKILVDAGANTCVGDYFDPLAAKLYDRSAEKELWLSEIFLAHGVKLSPTPQDYTSEKWGIASLAHTFILKLERGDSQGIAAIQSHISNALSTQRGVDSWILASFGRNLSIESLRAVDVVNAFRLKVSPHVLEFVFCAACQHRSVEWVKRLLDLRVNVEARSNLPLVFAASVTSREHAKALELVTLLVESGANVREAEVLMHPESLAPDDRAANNPLSWKQWRREEILFPGRHGHRGDILYAPRAYLRVIGDVLDPDSPRYIGRLVPKEMAERHQIGNCNSSELQRKPVFRLISQCAAIALVASELPNYRYPYGDLTKSEPLFLNFVSRAVAEIQATGQSIAHYESQARSALSASPQLLAGLCAAFTDTVVIPALVRRVGIDRVTLGRNNDEVQFFRNDVTSRVKVWLAGKLSLLELYKFLKKWERVHETYPRGDRADSRWVAVLPETELEPGVVVSAVTSHQDLVREGEAMNNCLRSGLYTTSCLLGATHILRIQRHGESVVNLTLVEAAEKEWIVSEYAGRNNNRSLCAELEGYVRLFKSELRSRSIPIHPGPYGQTPESIRASEDKLLHPLERFLGMSLRGSLQEVQAFFRGRLVINADRSRKGVNKLEFPSFGPETIPVEFNEFFNRIAGAELKGC